MGLSPRHRARLSTQALIHNIIRHLAPAQRRTKTGTAIAVRSKRDVADLQAYRRFIRT